MAAPKFVRNLELSQDPKTKAITLAHEYGELTLPEERARELMLELNRLLNGDSRRRAQEQGNLTGG